MSAVTEITHPGGVQGARDGTQANHVQSECLSHCTISLTLYISIPCSSFWNFLSLSSGTSLLLVAPFLLRNSQHGLLPSFLMGKPRPSGALVFAHPWVPQPEFATPTHGEYSHSRNLGVVPMSLPMACVFLSLSFRLSLCLFCCCLSSGQPCLPPSLRLSSFLRPPSLRVPFGVQPLARSRAVLNPRNLSARVFLSSCGGTTTAWPRATSGHRKCEVWQRGQ